MRVLHITASSMIGGGPEHLWQLVKHLPENIKSYIAGPECEPYGERFIRTVGHECFFPLPQRKFTLTTLKQLISYIKTNSIDIIHSHGKGAGMYGRLAALCTNAKSVHTFHGIHLPQNKVSRMAYTLLERFLCNVSKACISVSDGELQEAKNRGLADKKVHVIYNGIIVPKTLTERNIPKPFVILHVSRFDARQKNSLMLYNIALALQAKNLLEHCHFVLVGEGEELPLLQEKISHAGLANFFTYAGQQNSVQPFYEQAGCILSTSRWEGLPLSILEAASNGVPAVVSDVVGNKDAVVHEKTGFLYALDDANAAATCIEKLLHNEQLWQNFREQAYSMAREKFCVEKMARETANIYEAIV